MGDQSARSRGRWGEERAVAWYRQRGFDLLDRNWRSPHRELPGELDVVVGGPGLVVFCEVKARRRGGFGGAVASVDARKQAKVRALAAAWLGERDLPDADVRFDVIAIDGVTITHYESAF
jgi:putative endonuclease